MQPHIYHTGTRALFLGRRGFGILDTGILMGDAAVGVGGGGYWGFGACEREIEVTR